METEEEGDAAVAAERLVSDGEEREREREEDEPKREAEGAEDARGEGEDDVSQYLLERVYFAARDGFPLTLHALLTEQPPRRLHRLLNTAVHVDGIRCTPLVAAARNGQENVVRILLGKFANYVRLETEASVRFEDYVINGATALWAAAGAGHLKVVKRLARAGAQLDHATSTVSTPLRAACYDGRLDVVKYLVHRGADIHRPNQYNNTCLMIAAYKGHLDIVSYLLERGARIDEPAQCGATALHFAAECGHTSVVKELLDHGAKLSKNKNGMTPLIGAAERTRAGVVELILEKPEVTREQAIEALELLGASYANDKEFYCIPLAFQYLRKSMEMREGTVDLPPVPKVPSEPVPAYDNWKECKTLEDLLAIRENSSALHMEGLTIRERILGRSCPELPHSIVYRGAVFADNAHFDRCLSLWWHALSLRQENQVAVCKDLLRFAQVFSQMLHIGIEIPFPRVINILNACSLELMRNREKLDLPGPKDDVESLQEEYESNINTALYLITIVARLLSLNVENPSLQSCTAEEVCEAKRAVYHVIQPEPRVRDRQTLLHLALNPNITVDTFHTSDICKFPCFITSRLLLQCGADPNAQDLMKNTPLHYLAKSSEFVCNMDVSFELYNSMLSDLLLYGAHADTVNIDGKTPADLTQSGPVEMLLKKNWRGRLACLAAHVIGRYGLSYQGLVPIHLHPFIQLHGHLG